MDRKQGLALATIGLLLCSALAVLYSASVSLGHSSYIQHYPTIFIYSNGTISPRSANIQYTNDRYVITSDIYGGICVQKSDITIDGDGHKIYGYQGTALLLQNVTNVTVLNLHTLHFRYGLYLENVNNSSIKNITIVDCGIEIVQSSNNLVTKNNVSDLITTRNSSGIVIFDNLASGISLIKSNNITVESNKLSDVYLPNSTSTSGLFSEGISIDNSENCRILGNNIERKGVGINIWHSTKLSFEYNTLKDNQFGVKISGNTLSDYLHNIDISNMINEKPVLYLVNKTNSQISNTAGWIAAVNCNNITIQNWVSTPNWDGILFAYTNNSKVINSTLKNNFNALTLTNSLNCTITQNTLKDNQYSALYFEDSTNCAVTHNNIIDNLCFFYIWGTSKNNTIFCNNFVGNLTGSMEKNLGTQWNKDGDGNYWSCFTGVDLDDNNIGDSPFLIETYSGEKDLLPHLTPYNNGLSIPIREQTGNGYLAMPQETLNYTITNTNGTLWAKIDGTYPIHYSALDDDQPLSLFYPIPPNTTNIQIELDDNEVSFSNYNENYTDSFHYTDIGNWQMIYCSVNPASENFLLEIHYEHPIEIINGSYTYLYDLNINPYLSETSINSIAYFNINLENDLPNLYAYTTGFTGNWTNIEYNSILEDDTRKVNFCIISEYGKPLL
ncbi:MAG: hypothetical protein GX638_00815, partial [Crenarchaeota archaeon]|nr:hypothetical protein [Thermoproteota archaeon]